MPSEERNDREQDKTARAGNDKTKSGEREEHGDSSSPGNHDKKEDHPVDPRKKRRNTIVFAGVGVLVVIAAVVWYLYSLTYETTDDAQVDGHLNSIASRIAGTVVNVYAENNQPIKAGQILIELDPQDQQVQVEENRAQYEQALAKLAGDAPNVPITQTTNRSDIATDKSSLSSGEAALAGAEQTYQSNLAKLRQAEAADKKSKMDLIRYRKLAEKHELAESDLDQYVSTADSNQASVEASRAAAESSARTVDQQRAQLLQQQVKMREDAANAPQQLAIKRSTIEADRANVASAKAQLDSAMLNLSYCRIVSPVDGIASQRNAEIGARVNAAQQVLVIVQTQNIFVTANFKETQLKKMRPGQQVRIKVDALGQSFDGEVEYMPSATGDRDSLFPPENATGNYVKVVQRLPVRIKFKPNQADLDRLRPGMSVEPKVDLD